MSTTQAQSLFWETLLQLIKNFHDIFPEHAGLEGMLSTITAAVKSPLQSKMILKMWHIMYRDHRDVIDARDVKQLTKCSPILESMDLLVLWEDPRFGPGEQAAFWDYIGNLCKCSEIYFGTGGDNKVAHREESQDLPQIIDQVLPRIIDEFKGEAFERMEMHNDPMIVDKFERIKASLTPSIQQKVLDLQQMMSSGAPPSVEYIQQLLEGLSGEEMVNLMRCAAEMKQVMEEVGYSLPSFDFMAMQ